MTSLSYRLSSGLLVAGILIPPALIPPTITPESTGVHYFSYVPPTSVSRPCTGILDHLPPELCDSCVKQVSQDQGYGTEDFGQPINSGLIQQQDADCDDRPIRATGELATREWSEYRDRPICVTKELETRERSEYRDRPIRVTEELETRDQYEDHDRLTNVSATSAQSDCVDRPIRITEELALETRENSVPKDSTLLPQQHPSNYQNYDHTSFPCSQSSLYSTTISADVSKHDISSPNPTFLDPSLGLLDIGQYDVEPPQNPHCFSSPRPTVNASKEEHLHCFSSPHPTVNASKEEHLQCFSSPHPTDNASKEEHLQCFSSPHPTDNASKEEHLQYFSSPHPTDNESKEENLQCFSSPRPTVNESHLRCLLSPEYESNYSHTSSSIVISTQSPVMPLGNTGFCVGGVVFGPPDDRDPLYRRPDCRRHYDLGPP